jgi:ATP-dependent Clp protease ATP-binding subunit ClpC
MYDKFTDRAKKVMQIANSEAQRLQHEYIGTEHILLALVREGAGVAANVLQILGVDLKKVRKDLETIVAGPVEFHSGKLPQAPRAKKAIEYAIEEARALKHNFVGTEHLLLGLLRGDGNVAAQVLINHGVQLPMAREEVCKLLGYPPDRARVASEFVDEEPEPTEILKPEIQHLPTSARAIVDEFDCQIISVRQEKEQMVAAQDFEAAAQLRELELKLTMLRKEFIAQWPKRT